MPSHWRAKKSTSWVWCALTPRTHEAERQNASALRKPARHSEYGHWAQASSRKRGSSSWAPMPSDSLPSCWRQVSCASRAASAASSICRPGEAPRCQAQSAKARLSAMGDRLPAAGAAAVCTRRSSRSVGVSVAGALGPGT